MTEDRLMNSGAEDKEETSFELNLRPEFLKEFIGQNKLKENLSIFIEAARRRKEPLDHTLFLGLQD